MTLLSRYKLLVYNIFKFYNFILFLRSPGLLCDDDLVNAQNGDGRIDSMLKRPLLKTKHFSWLAQLNRI